MKYFFPIYKNVNRTLSKKQKQTFKKGQLKGTKIFLKKKTTKGANMLVSDIEIFLKNKKKKTS